MSFLPLHPVDQTQTYIRGDVTIHPTVAIAPGVLIQAEANSQIIIGAGVCLGMGVVLHAAQGTLEIEENVNLGAGVLVVGQAKIKAGACVGASSTIFNASLEREQVVPAGSLIGDTSRRIVQSEQTDGTQADNTQADQARDLEPNAASLDVDGKESTQTAVPTVEASDAQSDDPWAIASEEKPEDQPNLAVDASPSVEVSSSPAEPSVNIVQVTQTQVYGQAYLNQLLVTLLPHRQALNSPLPTPPDQPTTDDS